MSDLRKERRQRWIKNLIQEAVINVLAEQDMQQQAPAPQPQQQQPQPPQDQAGGGHDPQDPTPYTVDAMIEELNSIRGGKSFGDPEVYGRLVSFFKNLSDEEKQTLDRLLSEISSLITGAPDEAQEEAQEIQEPQQQQQQKPQPTQQQAPPAQPQQPPQNAGQQPPISPG